MFKNIIKTTIVSFPLAFMIGCGGGGGSSKSTAAGFTGVLVDSAVSGVDYNCSSGTTGITNLLGEFTCNTGDTISFSLGEIHLGSASVGSILTPYTLFPNNPEAALNLAQFLQTIDSDGDPSNGITPDTALVTHILDENGGNAPDFEDADFDNIMITALMGSAVSLVGELQASEHLNETLVALGEPVQNAIDILSLDKNDEGSEPYISIGGELTLIKDIALGIDGSYPEEITKIGSKIYFSATDDIHGHEPWVSDGTAQGTVMLKDIVDGDDSSPSDFAGVEGDVYFLTGGMDRSLWRTDGTPGGTELLLDGQFPANLTVVGDKVYLSLDSKTNGYELHVIDKTQQSPVLLKDINEGSGGSFPRDLIAVGDKLYFSADDGKNGKELWVSDGTAEGTLRLTDISDDTLYFEQMKSMDDKLYVAIDNDTMPRNIWVSDGTTEGTVMLTDYTSVDESVEDVLKHNGQVYFTEYVDANTNKLYKIDASQEISLLNDSVKYISDLVSAGDTLLMVTDYNSFLNKVSESGEITAVTLSQEQQEWTYMSIYKNEDVLRDENSKYAYFGVYYTDSEDSWFAKARSDGTSLEVISDPRIDD